MCPLDRGRGHDTFAPHRLTPPPLDARIRHPAPAPVRLLLPALIGLFLLGPVRAQSDVGDAQFYVVFGDASPERALFPTGTAPVLSLGARVSPHVDVHVGYRGGEREVLGPASSLDPTFVDRTYTRAGTASAGAAAPLGRTRVEARASATYERYGRTRRAVPGGRETERADGQFVHTGASAALSLPFGSGRTDAALGVGLAVSHSEAVGGTLDAQRDRWMPFARLPIEVRVGRTARVAFEVTAGAYRFRPLAADRPARWVPVSDAALRVSF